MRIQTKGTTYIMTPNITSIFLSFLIVHQYHSSVSSSMPIQKVLELSINVTKGLKGWHTNTCNKSCSLSPIDWGAKFWWGKLWLIYYFGSFTVQVLLVPQWMTITLNIWKLKDRLPQMNETMIFDLNPIVFQQGLYLKWSFIDESDYKQFKSSIEISLTNH